MDAEHSAGCSGSCSGCATPCEHTPMEELTALMKYMAGGNAVQIRKLTQLAALLEQQGNRTTYDQVMAAVSDFEKGCLRLNVVLASLK